MQHGEKVAGIICYINSNVLEIQDRFWFWLQIFCRRQLVMFCDLWLAFCAAFADQKVPDETMQHAKTPTFSKFDCLKRMQMMYWTWTVSLQTFFGHYIVKAAAPKPAKRKQQSSQVTRKKSNPWDTPFGVRKLGQRAGSTVALFGTYSEVMWSHRFGLP